MNDPFDFFANVFAVREEGPPPPEAADNKAFNEAVEEIVRAFNIISRYDSRAMAAAWNRNMEKWETDQHCESCVAEVVITAQRVKLWLDGNPNLARHLLDLRVAALEYTDGRASKLVS